MHVDISLNSTGSVQLNTVATMLTILFLFSKEKMPESTKYLVLRLAEFIFSCFGHLSNLKCPKLPPYSIQVSKQHYREGGFSLCGHPLACDKQLHFNQLQTLKVTISCKGKIMEKLKSAASCRNLPERVLWSMIPNVYVLVFIWLIHWCSKISFLYSKKTTHIH